MGGMAEEIDVEAAAWRARQREFEERLEKQHGLR